MDELRLRKTLGNALFEKGLKAMRKGLDRVYSADGVEVYHVPDRKAYRTVVRRTYPDRPDEYSCDCSTEMCAHAAAVIISLDEGPSQDPGVVKEIERSIALVMTAVRSDPDFDENDYYESDYPHWDRWTRDAEHDAAAPIVERIVDDVHDPHEAIRLLDLLHREAENGSAEFEGGCGGFDAAFREHSKEIAAILHFADGRDLARIMSHGDMWSRRFVRRFPRDVEADAQAILRSGAVPEESMTDRMLENGEYEAYVEASGRSRESILKAAGILASADEARAEAVLCMDRTAVTTAGREWIADTMSELGMKAGAAVWYGALARDRCRDSPIEGYVARVRSVGSDAEAESTLDHILRREEASDGISLMAVSNLIACGRPEAADMLSRENFLGDEAWDEGNAAAAPLLAFRLEGIGRFQEAADLARGLAEHRLRARKASQYEDGAALLGSMAGDPRYEAVDPPHSVYIAGLRDRYGSKRMFWSVYDRVSGERKDGDEEER